MKYLLALILVLQTFHGSFSAPRYNFQGDGNLLDEILVEVNTIEKLTEEIKASLELVKLLPSPILSRKVTEAVVVLSQALTNPNPILHTACENALLGIKSEGATDLEGQDDDGLLNKLESFLSNLKHQLSAPGNMFPQNFAKWLRNQIRVVETTIEHNEAGISSLAEKIGSDDVKVVLKSFQYKITSFEAFLMEGMDALEMQPALQFNLELSELKKSLKIGKYNQLSTELVWHLLTDEDAETSIEFLPALNEIYKRAHPDLQVIPEAVLRSIEVFLKSLPETQYLSFLEQLGSWSPASATLPTSIPQGL